MLYAMQNLDYKNFLKTLTLRFKLFRMEEEYRYYAISYKKLSLRLFYLIVIVQMSINITISII
jgi:hypothetical protein